MAEALQLVKTKLGTEAVILHTRTITGRRWMGLRKHETYEITAGRDVNVVKRQLPAKPAPNPSSTPAQRSQVAAYQQLQRSAAAIQASKPAAPTPAAPRTLMETPAVTNAAMMSVTRDVQQLTEMVTDLVKVVRSSQTPNVPEELCGHYQGLIENMVAEELALEITKSLQKELRPDALANKTVVREKLAQHLEKLIPTAGPIARTKVTGPHIVALIGPTGVGKTTTIAKLAANLKLREKKKVGLITIDTFRIAAIDQLKRYADILGAPLKVVGNPEDMPAAIESMSDFDYILIDTAGRSPKDHLKLSELKRFISFAKPDEVMLVLSTTCDQKSVDLAVTNFGEVKYDKLIFTKVDETAQLGVVLNVARKVKKGLAYVTTGQDVPDDIEVGDRRRIANLILGNA
jgi:flagellar biosynthesis protein FlhF